VAFAVALSLRRVPTSWPKLWSKSSLNSVGGAYSVEDKAIGSNIVTVGTSWNDSGTMRNDERNDLEQSENIDELLLAKMRIDKRISVKQLSKMFGKSKTSMFRIIEKLKLAGKIRRIGSDKSGTWEVLD
jgi:predicted HTH transcriptional regulator